MSLAIRLEKIRFLAQELELAHALACAQPTDYLKRAMARRVLIRARDFVAHARLCCRALWLRAACPTLAMAIGNGRVITVLGTA